MKFGENFDNHLVIFTRNVHVLGNSVSDQLLCDDSRNFGYKLFMYLSALFGQFQTKHFIDNSISYVLTFYSSVERFVCNVDNYLNLDIRSKATSRGSVLGRSSTVPSFLYLTVFPSATLIRVVLRWVELS